MLTAAGFTVEGGRTIAVNLEGSRSEAIGRYAAGVLQRIRSVIAGRLLPEDLTALDQLLDSSTPNSILAGLRQGVEQLPVVRGQLVHGADEVLDVGP